MTEYGTHTFLTIYDQHADRDGQRCVLLGARNSATHPDLYDAEIGNLYLIQFSDGRQIEAWPEELIPNPDE